METRRLAVLLELSRRGSMREVADVLGTTTSSVSQQVAALAREVRTPLLEPHGRHVRLTPAGRRLAEHAVTVLAAVDAAVRDLDPDAEPAGTVRVAGFATAIRRSLLPTAAALARDHPRVRLVIGEHEPAEADALLAAGEVDLALTYDYDLAPAAPGPGREAVALWSTRWGLGVPAGSVPVTGAAGTRDVLRAAADHEWIGNSRNRADEEVLRTLAALAGVVPRITHEADGLELVEDLVVAGLGVGLLPVDRPTGPGVEVLPLTDPSVTLRARAVTRRGHATWPPLALVLGRLAGQAGRTSSATG